MITILSFFVSCIQKRPSKIGVVTCLNGHVTPSLETKKLQHIWRTSVELDWLNWAVTDGISLMFSPHHDTIILSVSQYMKYGLRYVTHLRLLTELISFTFHVTSPLFCHSLSCSAVLHTRFLCRSTLNRNRTADAWYWWRLSMFTGRGRLRLTHRSLLKALRSEWLPLLVSFTVSVRRMRIEENCWKFSVKGDTVITRLVYCSWEHAYSHASTHVSL